MGGIVKKELKSNDSLSAITPYIVVIGKSGIRSDFIQRGFYILYLCRVKLEEISFIELVLLKIPRVVTYLRG